MNIRRYLDAVYLPTPSGQCSARAISEMQWAMLEALRSTEPLPDEMRSRLCFAFENVCAGVFDELLQPLPSPGQPVPPILRHMQEAAIRYLRWVEDGRIEDHQPKKTVAACYGVTEKTVGNWLDSWDGKQVSDLFDDFQKPEVVKKFMLATGGRYPKRKSNR